MTRMFLIVFLPMYEFRILGVMTQPTAAETESPIKSMKTFFRGKHIFPSLAFMTV